LASEIGIATEERNLEIYDVAEADEAFFTGTPFCMIPCAEINTYKIGAGKMGPITKRLITEWGQRVGVDIIAQAREFVADMGNDAYGLTNPYSFGVAKPK
jgi:branched-chain amino acid aminotransferase